jgi:catalase
VAFHTGNLVPGIEPTNDPLMQARLFSYLDTQLTRLGGPNFSQLPINRPHCPVNDMLRDGMHQTAIHTGLAPYRPNSIDGGEPQIADADEGGYVLTDVERAHIVEAFTFELGKCYEQVIKERQLTVLANVDTELCEAVAAGLGLPAPKGSPPQEITPSPALSQVYAEPGSVAGRKVGIIADAGADLAGVAELIKALTEQGVVPLLTAPIGGVLKSGRRSEIVERTYLTARSVEFDAVVVAAGTASADIKLITLLREAFRHCKPIAA